LGVSPNFPLPLIFHLGVVYPAHSYSAVKPQQIIAVFAVRPLLFLGVLAVSLCVRCLMTKRWDGLCLVSVTCTRDRGHDEGDRIVVATQRLFPAGETVAQICEAARTT